LAQLPYAREMAYDDALAARVRELLLDEPGISEKKMFGGLAFLINGNMAVSVSGEGGIFFRVDQATAETLVATSPARPMEMGGRAMRGWLRVDAEFVRGKRELERWVSSGVAYTRSLPPKRR
jgi:TfoX/Sxy family transcriptional regulator of competence genes